MNNTKRDLISYFFTMDKIMTPKIILAIVLVLCVHSALAQNEPTEADLGVAAIGLVVSDIEKSEQFYTDILGMKPYASFELTKQWSDEAGMSNGLPFAVRMYRLVEQNSATVLKLAYFDDGVPRKAFPSGINEVSGVNYLTFHYNNLEPVLKRIRQAGIEIIGDVERSYKLVIIRDPDGVYIELVQPERE